ncbi:Aste57867_23280 [Aphanomyces stellatus]|uniref:Aste57867_23280 protein n=1 Tax=Aphanomyces stellatus TaxID=120398 RepID=A0A485LP59_9STRA|nr:hypothetical protein As57867_023209 [Aphanomyces stellatus]VFT99925.1 Aste57867_23280 [Aphanomyces stellatus]
MGHKASRNKVSNLSPVTTREPRERPPANKSGPRRSSVSGLPQVSEPKETQAEDVFLDQKGEYKLYLGTDARVYWVAKDGTRHNTEPMAIRRRASRDFSNMPVAHEPIHLMASIPGTIEETAEQTGTVASIKELKPLVMDAIGPDSRVDVSRESCDVKTQRADELAQEPQTTTPVVVQEPMLSKEASIAKILRDAVKSKPPTPNDTTTVTISSVLHDALCDAEFVVPHQVRVDPPQAKEAKVGQMLQGALAGADVVETKALTSLTNEASIAYILNNALVGADTARPQTSQLTKEASIAHILNNALVGADNFKPQLTQLTKEASIAHILNSALDGRDVRTETKTLTKEASVALILKAALMDAGTGSRESEAVATPHHTLLNAVDNSVVAASDTPSHIDTTRGAMFVNSPTSSAPDCRASLESASRMNPSASRLLRNASRDTSRPPMERSQTGLGLMSTSPSTAILVPSESRAALNQLLLADEHAAAAATSKVDATPPSPLPSEDNRGRQNFKQRRSSGQEGSSSAAGTDPTPSDRGSMMTPRNTRLSVPGGEERPSFSHRQAKTPQLSASFSSHGDHPTADEARAELNKLLAATQQAVLAQIHEASTGTTANAQQPLPGNSAAASPTGRSTRATFTLGSAIPLKPLAATQADGQMTTEVPPTLGGPPPPKARPTRASFIRGAGRDPSQAAAPMLGHSPSRSARHLHTSGGSGSDGQHQTMATPYTGGHESDATNPIGMMRMSPSKAVLVPSASRAELNQLLLADQHAAAKNDEESTTSPIGMMRMSPSKAVLVPSASRAELNQLLLADQHAATMNDEEPTRSSVGMMRMSPSKAVLVPSASRAELNHLLLADQLVSSDQPSEGGSHGIGLMQTSPSKAKLIPLSAMSDRPRNHAEPGLSHSPSRSARHLRTHGDAPRDGLQRSSTGHRGLGMSPSRTVVGSQGQVVMEASSSDGPDNSLGLLRMSPSKARLLSLQTLQSSPSKSHLEAAQDAPLQHSPSRSARLARVVGTTAKTSEVVDGAGLEASTQSPAELERIVSDGSMDDRRLSKVASTSDTEATTNDAGGAKSPSRPPEQPGRANAKQPAPAVDATRQVEDERISRAPLDGEAVIP